MQHHVNYFSHKGVWYEKDLGGSSFVCFLLFGCASTGHEKEWRLEGSCGAEKGCEIRGRISGKFGGGAQGFLEKSPLLVSALLSSGVVPDAQLFSLQVNGQVNFPSQGQAILSLYNSDTGVVYATGVFEWIRNGSSIMLSDPDAVNTWAISNGGYANSLSYDFVPWQASGSPGISEVSIVAVYDSVPTAFAQYVACFDMRGEIREVENQICQ